jgi:hypothetical protein
LRESDVTKSKGGSSAVEEKLDQLIWVTQDLLILQALQAGGNIGDVRKIARVNTDRVTNISKFLRRTKGG